MRLSIIIPVYKVEPFVGTCLRSILDTTVSSERFEVIVVNDGTPDSSMTIVQEICADCKNVRLIEQDNQGLSAARMNGAAIAQGDYVWFIDSDDWLKEDAVRTVLQKIEQTHPDVLITPLHWRFPDSVEDYVDINLTENKCCTGKECLSNSISPAWAAQRFIFRKELLENKWLYFPLNTLHEDEYFGRILLYSADFVYVLVESLYNYRQRENSIMSNITIKSGYDLIAIYRLLTLFLSQEVCMEDRQWFRRNIFKDVLMVSYYRCMPVLEKLEFNKFILKYRWHIVAEYIKSKPSKSFKKILGDICFILFPYKYSRFIGFRYIQ